MAARETEDHRRLGWLHPVPVPPVPPVPRGIPVQVPGGGVDGLADPVPHRPFMRVSIRAGLAIPVNGEADQVEIDQGG
jgi:hypothetical protein